MKSAKFLASTAVVFGAIFTTSAAKADDWGCQVLLCLSNPAGPMAVKECVPPITRLYRAIFKTKPDPFPTCTMANSSTHGNSYAVVEYNSHYDPCPKGTKALMHGAFATVGTAQQVRQHRSTRYSWLSKRPFDHIGLSLARGIGTGNGFRRDYGNDDNMLPRKVCVGKPLGVVYSVRRYKDDEYAYKTDRRTVHVFDSIKYIDPYQSGNAIKVYINNKLYRVVRP